MARGTQAKSCIAEVLEEPKVGGASPIEAVYTDDELARMVGAGDDRAWEILVSRHAGKLYSICLGSTGNREAAEDRVQETWLSLWEHCDKIQNGGVVGLLYKIVWSRCIDHARKQSRRVEEVPFLIGDHTDEEHLVISKPDGVEEEILLEELMAKATLLEKERFVVWMRYAEEWSFDEIADLLGCSHTTIRTIAARAILKIRNGGARGAAAI